RYYTVTPAGRAHLRAETASLKSSVAALETILDAAR
ncbi:MAG: PadR family transcriptional regulator, partial [Gemmatimonadales bacterium]|nr:PadR family transcriptional regulator [Gemmatimonadales bacterium]